MSHMPEITRRDMVTMLAGHPEGIIRIRVCNAPARVGAIRPSPKWIWKITYRPDGGRANTEIICPRPYPTCRRNAIEKVDNLLRSVLDIDRGKLDNETYDQILAALRKSDVYEPSKVEEPTT